MFKVYGVLEDKYICNQKEVIAELKKSLSGRATPQRVIYGKRNMGKTSILKSIAMPYFKGKYKNSFCLYVDLLGVDSMDSLENRFSIAFEKAFTSAFPRKKTFQSMIDSIRSIEPSIEVDASGQFKLTLGGWRSFDKKNSLNEIFLALGEILKKVKVLIILDEFQDIKNVSEGPEILRDLLQNLPSETPVFLSGSKKHLLSLMFAAYQAPLYNWGEPINIEPIPYEEYFVYISDHFNERSLTISLQDCQYLQDLMLRNCEAINVLCNHIFLNHPPGAVKRTDIDKYLEDLLDRRQGQFEEYLISFTPAERNILIAFAKEDIAKPTSHNVVKMLNASKATIEKATKRFIDRAILYKEKEKYELADPLLRAFLRSYR